MLDRGSFFLSFLSELSQEMLLEKHSWCELEQLNYPKQQGDGAGGRTHKPGPLLPAKWSCHLQTDSCMSSLAERVRLTGGLGVTSGNCWHPRVLGIPLVMVTIVTASN